MQHAAAADAHVVAALSRHSHTSSLSRPGAALRPSFVLDEEPAAATRRVWACDRPRACAACTCWRDCLGLRWNLRNTRRFVSWQFCATMLYAFACVYFNTLMQVRAEKRSRTFRALPIKYNFTIADEHTFTTLPDIGFDILPMVHDAWLADVMVGLLVALTQCRFSLTPMGATILRRWAFLLGSLFFLRGISIIVTMLPNPLKACKSDALDHEPAFAAVLILTGQIVTCGDVLFSGHTVNIVMAGLVWQTYSHKAGVQLLKPNVCPALFDPIAALCCKNRPAENEVGHLVRATTAKILVWVFVTAGMLVIIATRFHYTIDVFIGFCLCFFIWKLYHYYCLTIYVDKEKYINKLLMWLEHDSQEFYIDKGLAERGLAAIKMMLAEVAQERERDDRDTVALSDVVVALPTGSPAAGEAGKSVGNEKEAL